MQTVADNSTTSKYFADMFLFKNRDSIQTELGRACTAKCIWCSVFPCDSLKGILVQWCIVSCRPIRCSSSAVQSKSNVLRCVALRCVTLRYVALRCVALRCVALRCVALRCVALRCVALRCVALRCVALLCLALPCLALPCLALRYVAFPCVALLFLALRCFARRVCTIVQGWSCILSF